MIEAVKKLFEDDPSLSLRKAANFVPISQSTIRTIAKVDLNMSAYKVRKTFLLKPADKSKRFEFVEWMRSRSSGSLDWIEKWLICSDEAYFYMNGGTNTQNDRIWSSQAPKTVRESALFEQKVLVWCAFSSEKVYGPYFFENTVNWENYMQMLTKFFWPRHKRLKNHQFYFFQQDGAPPHRKKEVQEWLKGKFGARFLDLSIWPPRSPDLNPCDFSLWGTIKSKCYNPKPLSLDMLKENITREIRNFEKTDLKSVFSNMKKRLVLVEAQKGGHIEHLL